MKQIINLQLHGALVLDVLICLQITELKWMLEKCSLKIDEIEFTIQKLKEANQ